MTFARRHLFVGGLHRSGTSLVARMAAGLPGVSGIEGAPVPENEGVYLQGAIPHDALAGRPMEFATDPAQHLTEAHTLNALATRERLLADWTPWFDPDARWWIEKSPVNLTRMRLMQQLFPMAQFVVVMRHPAAVAAAVAKWMDRPVPDLIDHWIAAHAQVAEDLERVHAALVLRYEDVVARPESARRALAAFLDLTAPTGGGEAVRDANADYAGAPGPSEVQSAALRSWGYGPELRTDPPAFVRVRHPLRSIREATLRALGEAG